MIIAIVNFALQDTMDLKQAAELYRASAPNYEGLPGLLRKHYLFRPGSGGGVYLWESQEAADKLYTKEWAAGIAKRFGSQPEITFFDNPVIVDNQ